MGKPKVTLKDIALRTGYAVNTVSLALRGSTRISTSVRTLIRDTAHELDYIPNAIAKSLASQRSHTVGLILHEITNPLVTSAAKMIQLALAAHGYGVLFATSNGSFEEELHAIEMFRSRMVDGILIYPLLQSRLDHLRQMREHHFPVVLLIGLKDTGIDAVGVDETRAAYDATRHLIEIGHRRIGTIINTPAGVRDHAADRLADPQHSRKFAGYAAALRDAGLSVAPERIASPMNHSIAGGLEGMNQLMNRPHPPTAVFADSDILALGALRWARLNGAAVPDDVAIMGFDNIEAAEQAVTPISTINNDVERLAQLSVERLLQLIDAAGSLPAPLTQFVPGNVVVRESTARPTVENERITQALSTGPARRVDAAS